MSSQLHQHNDAKAVSQAAGKQIAALLRLSLVSVGAASIAISGDPEVSEVLPFLAEAEGVDWSKVMIYSTSEYLGVPRTARGSLQYTTNKYLIERKPISLKSGMINGEAVPHSELKRLTNQITNHPPDLFLMSVGTQGEVGLLEPGQKFSTELGYELCEPSETFRKAQITTNGFKSLNDVPRRGITMSLPLILRAKHIVCCICGTKKESMIKALLSDTQNAGPANDLKNHADFHIHTDQPAPALTEKSSL